MIPNTPPPTPAEQQSNKIMRDDGVKRRRRLLPQETAFLMEIFERSPRPSPQIREWISSKLGHLLSMRAIQIWFQNRRAKVRREFQELHSSPPTNTLQQLLPPPPLTLTSSPISTSTSPTKQLTDESHDDYSDDPFLLQVIKEQEPLTTFQRQTNTANGIIFDWTLMEEDFFL